MANKHKKRKRKIKKMQWLKGGSIPSASSNFKTTNIMNTKKQQKLVTDAIKNTKAYGWKNIKFSTNGVGDNLSVKVWSANNSSNAFHSIEIGAMAEAMGFCSYVSYNKVEDRCELTIF